MDEKTYAPEVLDLRAQSGVWKRVNPQIPPYGGEDTSDEQSGQSAALQQRRVHGEAALPGAVVDPCCMGSAAAESLAVLTAFGEDELAECRQLQMLSRQAPLWAAGTLRELAQQHAGQAKRLFAVYYLITGSCYTPMTLQMRGRSGAWCPALRQRYHAAACGGMNYERAAEETIDVCLKKLLRELSEASYRQAETLLRLLERSIGCG